MLQLHFSTVRSLSLEIANPATSGNGKMIRIMTQHVRNETKDDIHQTYPQNTMMS